MNVPHYHAVTLVSTLLVHSVVSALLDFILPVIGAPVQDLAVGVQLRSVGINNQRNLLPCSAFVSVLLANQKLMPLVPVTISIVENNVPSELWEATFGARGFTRERVEMKGIFPWEPHYCELSCISN